MDFIETNTNVERDDSAKNLIGEMNLNKSYLTQLIGEAKFKEEMELLIKMDEQEQKKGEF